VPTVDERIRGIIENYPDRSFRPLSTIHGRTLREDCLQEPRTTDRTVAVGDHESITVKDTVSREALPWIGAVETLLRKYERYRDKYLKMSRGSERRGDYEAFEIDLSMSYSQKYQSKQYARLKATKRQTVGGEYPDGTECEGEFSEPVVCLLGLTTSSLDGTGEYRPPVDHDREVREAWSGSSSSVKRTLRYLLEDKMGLDSSDYVWWWQSEPHPGPDKAATAYSHSHPVIILDEAAAISSAPEPTDPETWRPVVAKHVSECEGAGWDAHRLERSVSVSRADEIGDIVGYVSEYLAVAPDEDLLERSDEYLLWAAAQFASSTQKYSRSKWAVAAAQADACQQRYLDPETDQTHEHGERVVRSSGGASHRFECAECGSPHGIDQSQESLARMRLDASATASSPSPSSTAVTDGGTATDDTGTQTATQTRESAPETLAERWPSARSGGRISSPVREAGEPGETVVEGFDRPPEWSPESVIQKWSDEEMVIGEPSGVDYGQIVVPGAESILETTPLDHLPDPSVLEGPEPWSDGWVVVPDVPIPDEGLEGASETTWAEHVRQTRPSDKWRVRDGVTEMLSGQSPGWLTETVVRLGLVPPPELLARELAERTQTGREVTPKKWPSDWYARRYERADDDDELADGLDDSTREAIDDLVRVDGITSVPSVLGRLGIDPDRADEVREVVRESSRVN
jgi:hypothetical protein